MSEDLILNLVIVLFVLISIYYISNLVLSVYRLSQVGKVLYEDKNHRIVDYLEILGVLLVAVMLVSINLPRHKLTVLFILFISLLKILYLSLKIKTKQKFYASGIIVSSKIILWSEIVDYDISEEDTSEGVYLLVLKFKKSKSINEVEYMINKEDKEKVDLLINDLIQTGEDK